jgi:hypothetical protein
MHVLRTSSIFARLVLAWFVLTLGVAGASPIVHPQMMPICSADGGVRFIAIGDDGQPVNVSQHTLDCSLCFAATVPLPAVPSLPATPQPLTHTLAQAASTHVVVAPVGAPLPPRGPPSLV